MGKDSQDSAGLCISQLLEFGNNFYLNVVRMGFKCFPSDITYFYRQRKKCIFEIQGPGHHILFGTEKKKKNTLPPTKTKEARAMIIIKERTAVKIASKYCRMGLENILERTKVGEKKVMKSYLK